jgi:hypothetical protein
MPTSNIGKSTFIDDSLALIKMPNEKTSLSNEDGDVRESTFRHSYICVRKMYLLLWLCCSCQIVIIPFSIQTRNLTAETAPAKLWPVLIPGEVRKRNPMR